MVLFQSTLPRREWPFLTILWCCTLIFQSTLPRREWRRPYAIVFLQARHFNPHSHAGSDRLYAIVFLQARHFNPHSHAGSDPFCILIDACLTISIHTPTQGVTFRRNVVPRAPSWFQSTLPRREWPRDAPCVSDSSWFQSTLPRREWPHYPPAFSYSYKFQSTLPRREWLFDFYP